jgi:ferredoxin
MADIAVLYFSGTGNTAWVVRELAQRLAALGDEVSSLSCEEALPHDAAIAGASMLGVAFPVHGSWAPSNLRTFLSHLPAAPGRPLFVLAVPAIFGGDAAWYAARPLRRKGYGPFLYANVFMPNNLYPVPGLSQVRQILGRAAHKLDRLAPLIHARKRHLEGVHPLGWLGGYLQRWSLVLGERWLQGRWFADASCIRCGRCAARCPAGNIEVNETGVHFGDACVFCTRCFHGCPQHAIQFTGVTRNQSWFRRYPGPEGQA